MPGEITELLAEVREGNSASESRLVELVYDQLYGIAAHYMRFERPDHSLQATLLVDDAYLHLVNEDDRNYQNRSHFYAVAAQVMRRILIDHARARNAAKRGGRLAIVKLEDAAVLTEDRCEELIAVDEALTHLAQHDPRMARIVEMRFFAGLTEEEIADLLGVSSRTVKREWQFARVWLHAELSGQNDV